VVGYGPFSLSVFHKEGLCPSSGDINRLTMMMMNVVKDIFLSSMEDSGQKVNKAEDDSI
jgi:hypothetical protein